jgi:hypothetical protein
MLYKNIVSKIKNLHWENLSVDDLHNLMILSSYTAIEFAESLRIALEIYPESENLRTMSEGELKTGNLKFSDYTTVGDHAEFLLHFIGDIPPSQHQAAQDAGEMYLKRVRELPRKIRAMSIFSREKELPGIFVKVLRAKSWPEPKLNAYAYYLQEHIRLDSGRGGHAELLSDFKVTDAVCAYYATRLNMYSCIPKLF